MRKTTRRNAPSRGSVITPCLGCEKPVHRFRSQLKDKTFCSRECTDAYGLIEVQCTWPGCSAPIPARQSVLARHGLVFKTVLSKRGNYSKYPICAPHVQRFLTVLGPTARLNSFHRIIKNPDGFYPGRSLSRIAKLVLFERTGGVCQHCRGALDFNAPPKTWQVDHIVPVYRGGKTEFANLQLLCRACHDQKSAGEKSDATKQRHQLTKTNRWFTHTEKDVLVAELREEIALLRGRIMTLEQARIEADSFA